MLHSSGARCNIRWQPDLSRFRAVENGDEMSRVRTAAGRYADAKTATEQARQELHSAILAALAAGLPIGKVATESGYDREHVRRIRDGA